MLQWYRRSKSTWNKDPESSPVYVTINQSMLRLKSSLFSFSPSSQRTSLKRFFSFRSHSWLIRCRRDPVGDVTEAPLNRSTCSRRYQTRCLISHPKSQQCQARIPSIGTDCGPFCTRFLGLISILYPLDLRYNRILNNLWSWGPGGGDTVGGMHLYVLYVYLRSK